MKNYKRILIALMAFIMPFFVGAFSEWTIDFSTFATKDRFLMISMAIAFAVAVILFPEGEI